MSGTTAKSIVDIDVNDESFRRFMDLFDRYQAELKNSTKAWEEAGEATSDAADEAQKLLDPAEAVAAAAAVAAAGHDKIVSMLAMQSSIMFGIGEQENKHLTQLAHILETQNRAEDTTKRQSTLWHGLVTSTRGVAHWIAAATGDLLKWGSIAGFAGGLLGFGGGLFGLDRLGAVASGWRRQAMGLGLGGEIGTPQAFNAFSRLVDPQSFLGGIQSAIQDPTKRLPFSILGMGQPGYNANPASIAADVLQRLPGYVRGQQAAGIPLETMFQAGQFGNLGISFQDFVRLGQTAPKEMGELVQKFRQQAAVLDKLVTPDIAKRWQDFTLQLQFAGQTLQATLIRGLVNLTGPMANLSNALVGFLQKLTNTKNIDDFVGALGKGLDWIAKWVNSISEKDINDFENGVKRVGQDILAFGANALKAMEWINHWLGGGAAPGGSTSPPPAGSIGVEPGGHWTGPGNQLWQNPSGTIVDPQTGKQFRENDGIYQEVPGTGGGIQKQGFMGPPAGWSGGIQQAAFVQAEGMSGLPPGTLKAVEWAESRGDPNARSPAGALGAFQFEPGTARELGINPLDPMQSLWGAGEYLGKLYKQFGGNLEEALAAYNAGAGNVLSALRKAAQSHTENWMQYLPKPQETIPYVASIMKQLGIPGTAPRYIPPTTVQVVIHNNSGSNVHVTTGQLGVGVSI